MCCKQDGEWDTNDDQMACEWSNDKSLEPRWDHEGCPGIKAIYGKKLAETVGTMHEHLGKTFDYSFTKEVRINMWDFLQKVIKKFSEEITGLCATLASDYLFKVHKDRRKLNK